jgi:tape measure domain-containing protein
MADPKIKYDIEANVKGDAEVGQLAGKLEALAQTLDGELKTNALAAAAALNQLGSQKNALDGFKALASESRTLGSALETASQKADRLSAEIPQASAATKELAQAQAKAAAELAAVKKPLDEQTAALSKLDSSYKKGKISFEEYRDSGNQLKSVIADLNQDFKRKEQALAAASKATKESAIAEKTLTGQYEVAIDAAKMLSAQVGAKSRALDASRAALKSAGVETTGLAETERKLKDAIASTTSEAQKLVPAYQKAGQQAVASAAQQKQASADVGTGLAGVGGLLRQLGPLMATAFSAQQFVSAITSAESLNRSYEQVFGSTARARQEMEFIKTTSNRLGLETLDLARSYQSLAASTKGTVLEGQATRDIFEAVSRAMSTLGKSGVETERALAAISQMASKGTVSMEELRGQLGEALPGAMKAAADGAGLTVEQLVEMVSTGSVLAKDLLPALTAGLNGLYGQAAPPGTVIAEWARFKNQITETSMAIGEGGASKGLASLLTSLTSGFGSFIGVTDKVGSSLGEVAFNTVQAVKSSAAYYEKLLVLDTAAGKLTSSTDKAAIAQTALATAQLAAGQSAQEAIRHQELLAQKFEVSGESALKVRQRYLELGKGSADYVAQVEKEVAARTAESAVLTQLVNVYGTEIEKRQVAVSVAREQAAVADKLASARNTEAIIAASYVIKLQEQAKATGDVTEATKKQIEEAQKSATAKQTEFERTDALAKAKRIETQATQAQTQALQDNSGRVGEYASAMQAAAASLERLTQAHQNGKATEQAVTDGRAKLAAATLLYRDALADATKAAELKIIQEQRAGQLVQAAIGLDIERAKAAQEVAVAQGDSAKATAAATQVTNLQVQASQAAAEAARSEAEAIRQGADKREAELKARGALTAAAKEEIAARRQTADLKDIEAQKSDILTAKILALAQANKTETASLEAKNAAQERANAAAEKAIELENKRLNRDKEGFSLDTSGQRVNMAVETKASIYEKAKQQGLTEEQALRLSNNTALPYNGISPHVPNANGDSGENWSTRLQDEINKQKLLNAANPSKSGTGSGNSYTTNVTIDGAPLRINTSDAASDSNLQNVLRQLASARATSSR